MDIVAAEAYYHVSCYKAYTKTTKSVSSVSAAEGHASCAEEEYKNKTKTAMALLFKYIRGDVFLNSRIIPMTELTCKLASYLQGLGVVISESTKNNLRRNLEAEYIDVPGCLMEFLKLLLGSSNILTYGPRVSADSVRWCRL